MYLPLVISQADITDNLLRGFFISLGVFAKQPMFWIVIGLILFSFAVKIVLRRK